MYNPIKYYTIDTKDLALMNTPAFIGELDFSPYIRVRKHYYNNTSKTEGLTKTKALDPSIVIGSDFVEAHEIPKR